MKKWINFYLISMLYINVIAQHNIETRDNKYENINISENIDSVDSKNIYNHRSMYLYVGSKYPESRKYPGTVAGVAFGTGLKIPLNDFFFIKIGYAYWNAKSKVEIEEKRSVSISSGNLLFGYVGGFDRASINLALGPEISRSIGYTTIGFKLESCFAYLIRNDINIYLGLAYQEAATLDPGGGGVGYNPIILLIGCEIIL